MCLNPGMEPSTTVAVASPPLELGRYRVIEEVARGPEGVVYKARDPLIDRLVTIRTIDVGLPSSEYEAFRRRVDRELKSAGRLNHPNIVTIHDVGTSGDIAYIAMEFMDGRSLRDMLKAGVVLLPSKAADIAAQVADGLEFVHQRGIVHRDIKPDNVMVLRSGVVKITDFGIARLSRGSHTLIAELVASPRYTSPEQVIGEKIDERSDIFSLGAVLYEMLTGVPPFAGGRLHEIAHQVINDVPPAPSTRNRSVSSAFDVIVAKAMPKRPDDRYRNAREMAAELRRAAHAAPAITPEALAALEPETALQPIADEASVANPPADDPKLIEALSAPAEFPAVDSSRRWLPLAFYTAPVVLLVALAGWMLLSPETPEPPPGSAKIAVAIDTTQGVPTTASPGETSAPSLLTKAEPIASPAAIPTVKEEAVSAPKSTARLTLTVSPWGEVFVDGQRKGISPPMKELKLPPGKYTIEIRNTTFPPYRQSVDLRGATSAKINHKFQ